MILIAGPCVIEDEDTLKQTVEGILQSIQNLNIDFYFKASIQKDNRTKTENYQGMHSFLEGIHILNYIKQKYHVKICTDFHSVEQIEAFRHFVDLIQIPAFLARQMSLLKAASKILVEFENIKIHIKKPQFMSPENIHIPINILKDYDVKDHQIIISDRGTCFGYDQLIMDPRHIRIMKNFDPRIKVLADITHPNKNYSSIVSNENLAQILGLSAMASGADGLFLETHFDTTNSLCDSDTMIPLKKFKEMIKQFFHIYEYIYEEYKV